jgi:exopolyphosphatase/guanosine-5'-triphosphate,3'-diphosphate pyrophosphatase
VAGAVELQADLSGAAKLIGVAGTVSALTRLDQGLSSYDRSRIHHARLSHDAIERLFGELARLNISDRRRWPALETERAEVIIGGTAVLAEAMVVLGFNELTASESDLLDGVAAELLAR